MQILKTCRYTEWCITNFARSKVIIVDKKDPPLINEEIKCKIKISKQGISTIEKGKKIIDFEIVE